MGIHNICFYKETNKNTAKASLHRLLVKPFAELSLKCAPY